MYQEDSEECEKDLTGWPFWEVEGGEQVLDKVIKQRSEILLLFPPTTPDDRDRSEEV